MKKQIALLLAITIIGSISAQNKVAYLDLYQRGGAKHLRTTLIFNQEPVYIGKKNLGEVLNMLAESGWEIDRTLNVRRLGWSWPFTRHKFHVILKKEYSNKENLFEGMPIKVVNAIMHKPFFIQENITVINKSEFFKRQDLTEIHIHKNIVKIGKYAFSYCLNLKAIYCEASTPPELGFSAFHPLPKSAKIYVPATSEKLYKETKGWKKYADQIIGYNFE